MHLATVSRAVSGKYLQCEWGILPLRKFFSGGTEDASGQAHSWEAIRVQLQQIIDEQTEPWGIKVSVVEVEEIVETGSFDPDAVHLPGVYVHRLVLNPHPEKRIEKRTTQQNPKGA